MIDRAVKEFGRLDITYNNAGLSGAMGPIENISVEDWDKTLVFGQRFLGINTGSDHACTAVIDHLDHITGRSARRRYSRIFGCQSCRSQHNPLGGNSAGSRQDPRKLHMSWRY